mgnify:CR=1 FL=1
MTLSVPLKMESLMQISQWVENCLDQWLLPSAKNFAVQLCCEEAFSNVVKYGVTDSTTCESEPGLATFTLDCRRDQLQLVIEDSCKAFNPLETASPVVPNNLSEAKIGGLGIDLMKKFAQKIMYERKDYKNRMLFIFDLPSVKVTPLVD